MSKSGTLVLFPWLTIPSEIAVGGFRFAPISCSDPDPVVGPEIAPNLRDILRRHIDLHGAPVDTCTIALRRRHPIPWDIPAKLGQAVQNAARLLALLAISEQRYFESLGKHINSTIFRPIYQGTTIGRAEISLFVPRRGRSLRVGGYELPEVAFQMPLEAYGTECPALSTKLAKALDRAHSKKSPTAIRLQRSLPAFLLANSELSDLPTETCLILAAMSFEALLSPQKPGAVPLAEAFADLWRTHTHLTMASARRCKVDPSFPSEQQSWPVHKKWAKELYEARNSAAHPRGLAGRSANWSHNHHLVIAAFAYPLTVKLMLATEGHYTLSNEELGACDAVDLLLDSDNDPRQRRLPEWPNILSEQEQLRSIRNYLHRATAHNVDKRP